MRKRIAVHQNPLPVVCVSLLKYTLAVSTITNSVNITYKKKEEEKRKQTLGKSTKYLPVARCCLFYISSLGT